MNMILRNVLVIGGGVLAVIIVVGGSIWLVRRGLSGEPTASVTPTPVAMESPSVRVNRKAVSEQSASPPYTITGGYPVFEGLASVDVDAEVNAYVQIQFTLLADEFKKNMREMGSAPAGFTSELRVEEHMGLVNGQYVSGWFDVMEYAAGAAHPTSYYQTFNYDLAAGRPVVLKDLFKDGGNYLSAVASAAQRDLSAKFRAQEIPMDEVFQKGVAASVENYKTFYLINDALVIVFNPYHIASGAAGIQTATIPWAALADIRR